MDAEVMKKLGENINNEINEKSEEECKKERFSELTTLILNVKL